MKRTSLPELLLILSVILLMLFSFSLKKWDLPGGNSLMSWDANGYYAYLPAAFYDDLFHPDKTGKKILDLQIAGDMLPYHYVPRTGRAVMRYPIGESFGFLPAFGIAHLLADVHDGYSRPYGIVMGIWGLVIAIIGLLVLYLLLIRYFGPTTAATLIFVYVYATNYLNYASMSVMHTHNILFTLYAILCYWVDTQERRARHTWRYLVGVGMLCGWMAIIRPTDALSISIPLLWGSHSWGLFVNRLRYWIARPRLLVSMLFGSLTIAMIQMTYWHHATGKWIYNSYQDGMNFSWLRPHTYQYLFSYEKGWFTYTPIMIFAVLGLAAILYRRRLHAILIAIFMVITVYILSAWDAWGYGGSFSQRSIIQSYVLLSFPFAFVLEVASRQKWSRVLGWVVILVLSYVNIIMHIQANFTGEMESDIMSRNYFWKIIGHLNSGPEERKYLDIKYEMPEDRLSSLRLYDSVDITTLRGAEDSIYLSPPSGLRGPESGVVDTLMVMHLNPEVKWLRTSFAYLLSGPHHDKWRQVTIKMTQQDGDKVNDQYIKPFRFTSESGKWFNTDFDLKLNPDMPYTVYLTIDNYEVDKALYLDEIKTFVGE